MTKFGGGFFVAPNPIDFDAAFKGFTDIASNPAVFATVITVFGLYLVGVIWARWRDKKDLEKVISYFGSIWGLWESIIKVRLNDFELCIFFLNFIF